VREEEDQQVTKDQNAMMRDMGETVKEGLQTNSAMMALVMSSMSNKPLDDVLADMAKANAFFKTQG
jgi:two-component sensor histidine kinase